VSSDLSEASVLRWLAVWKWLRAGSYALHWCVLCRHVRNVPELWSLCPMDHFRLN